MKPLYKAITTFIRALRVIERRSRINSAIKSGMNVGSNTKFVGTQRFGSEPYLIDIGDNCLITDGVCFICHDGAWCVACGLDGIDLLESYGQFSLFGKISIGDNSFIGVNSVLLPGTSIGKNCIIGASAVVRGHYPDGSIIAGNPAKIIGQTEIYKNKNISRVVEIEKSKSPSERAKIIQISLMEVDDGEN